jgi:ribonuclease HI
MNRRKNFYAVRNGRTPGIYRSWEECKEQVEGYANAEFKGFATRQEAEDFMGGTVALKPKKFEIPRPLEIFGGPVKSSARAMETNNREGKVIIYTDGACTGNPGPGGYGVVLLRGDQRTELSAGFRRTTNNRMEILGCIEGLKALETPSDVALYSDSQYVVNAMRQSWAVNWRKRGWNRIQNGVLVPAANADLWETMLELCERHRVDFRWVRGHDGNVENERCDELARAAAASPSLGVDAGYEKAN